MHDAGQRFQKQVDTLVTKAVEGSLDFLVIAGGISDNYTITLRFVDELSSQLSKVGKTKLKFVAGNTDFYYHDSVVDKERKFREIRAEYQKRASYLPTHPVITPKVRIVGAESWYDYSLYRGRPIKLSSITRKKKFLFKNPDVVYLTDDYDYTLGLENTFDFRYSKQCRQEFVAELERLYRRCGKPQYNVAVQYFLPHQIFLDSRPFENYFGAFRGCKDTHILMRSWGVTDCVFGIDSHRKNIQYEGIIYNCVSKNYLEVSYDG